MAAARATGDGVLELRDVYGASPGKPGDPSAVTIQGKGAIWGQLDHGILRVTDPDPDDGEVFVSGADKAPRPIGDTTTLYIGRDIHFRITGGQYKLEFVKGSGIDLTTVGVGVATIIPDPTLFDDGDYALDGSKWKPIPQAPRFQVPFGKQPPPPAVP
jgi:hypothetical protein